MKRDKHIQDILDFYKKATLSELINAAGLVCYENHGNDVWLRGLVEFSNYCKMDCLYCGIRHSNSKVTRYRLLPEQIISIAKKGYENGLRTFVLQSGEDSYYTTDVLCSIIEGIKAGTGNNGDDVAITLSCGIRSRKDYELLKNAGADRYLIRFETSDKELHKYLRNGITLERRLEALRDLRDFDYQTGSGFMVGLPNETEEIRINNALLCHDLELDMVGIGPFIPHQDTPLRNESGLPLEYTIRILALVRLLLPKAHIPSTTAVGTVDKLGREKALKAGANVLMPNITPQDVKGNYLLYPNKVCLHETGFSGLICLKARTALSGKTLNYGKGQALRMVEN